MAGLRVLYELTHIDYAGERVGVDWTFFVHTGAGLVCFDAKLAPGDEPRKRLLGARDVDSSELATEPGAFTRELWWASATEHDSAVPEHGIGVFTPVWVPLEPGVEVHRSLTFDVCEAKRWTKRGRVAHLRLDLRARVEALTSAAELAPSLDATRLLPDANVPRPSQTAGELPRLFEASLEGVDDRVEVHAERVLMVDRATRLAADPRAGVLAEFLRRFTGADAATGGSVAGPPGYRPHAALYELRNRDGQAFWVGHSSSMGLRNDRRLIEALAAAAAPLGEVEGGDEPLGFIEHPSLLRELLGPLHAGEIGAAATALAELIAALIVQHPERAIVEREVYVRTAILDEHSGEWTRAFLVDPRPYTGPDTLAWLVVWTDAWTE